MIKQPTSQAVKAQQERLFFVCAQSGMTDVCVLNFSFSDPHNGGQSAVLFSCGEKKYIYKPRPSTADTAWADFLDALAPIIDVPLPRAVRPIFPLEESTTIVPFVEGREAKDETEARLFYTRCGALLALCMILGATDLHSENLIADGDSPLLVDLETLMSGVTPDRAARGAKLYDSLIFSHLLPNWMLQDDENIDVGALTGAGKNQLKLHGDPCPAYAYVEEICSGFRRTFIGLLKQREAVSKELERFAKASFRKLLRSTDLYGRLCDQIARMDSPEEKRASTERLCRAYQRGGEPWMQKMHRACESEINAVLRGDIPYFFSFGDECCLRDMDGIVAEDYYTCSPLDAARQRLAALRPEDGIAQERIIRLSLRAVCPKVEKDALPSARGVFDMLEAQVIEGCPCGWMGLTTGARGEAYFQSIGFDLYEGLLGVLVFYGALYEATGDEEVLRVIRSQYEEYRAWYIRPESRIRANAANICLTSGLGGHILALGYLARTLRDESYLRDAVMLLSRFNFDGFEDYESWDVYGGVSGLLVALPLLRGCGIDEQLAQIALQLADGICKTRPELTGYAHGAAGLTLALGAAQYVGGGVYSEDILRLLEWENTQYDEVEKNWLDLRNPERHGFMKGLCSGAPGIGLARMQLLKYTRDTQIADVCMMDLRRVREFLRAQRQSLRRDTLCCGNAALIVAERALLPQGECHSQLSAEPLLYHALETNDFPVGLFQGWAGVGYALARQLPGSRYGLFVWEVEA